MVSLNNLSSSSLFSVEQKVVLISGAGRGIGKALALYFGQIGAKVVCVSRSKSEIDQVVSTISELGGSALSLQLDVQNLADHDQVLNTILSEFGSVDILINNAGLNKRQLFEKVSEENFDLVFNVNFKGPFFLAKQVSKIMRGQKSGKIINIGSLAASYSMSQISVYAAAKAALLRLTKSLALELGSQNIQVNAICPGFIKTPLTEKLWSDENMKNWAFKRIPAQRLGLPEDILGTAIYLSSAASDYVNGQCIYVDGGYLSGEFWPLPEAATS
ncbi:MAG: glucose 1-dehydrogenase [SAR324 cluster bacterium]|jgi:NAD(P)-dependent dehydrogenase (short-subunit alcohol dehydrogenase family)|nr:glucose 1-dehydrogenase [SAR324 cluster bacterium]